MRKRRWQKGIRERGREKKKRKKGREDAVLCGLFAARSKAKTSVPLVALAVYSFDFFGCLGRK